MPTVQMWNGGQRSMFSPAVAFILTQFCEHFSFLWAGVLLEALNYAADNSCVVASLDYRTQFVLLFFFSSIWWTCSALYVREFYLSNRNVLYASVTCIVIHSFNLLLCMCWTSATSEDTSVLLNGSRPAAHTSRCDERHTFQMNFQGYDDA